ncbi:MAG: reprolysin-like metallopeptidase, partial [Cyclobacteriaceae bacterium]
MNKIAYPILIICAFLCFSATGQQKIWKEISGRKSTADQFQRKLSLDKNALNQSLERSGKKTIQLPLPDGSNVIFQLTPNSVMSPELAAKYPEIKSYNGLSLDGGLKAKVDFNGTALYASVRTEEGTVYIDPNDRLAPDTYQSYYTIDYKNFKEKKPVFTEPQLAKDGKQVDILKKPSTQTNASRTAGGLLRKYRIAIAANSNYSSFHGGTISSVLSAMVTTMNRVNAVYENDFSITMELIADNDKIIFLSSVNDPYAGLSDPIDFLSENGSVLNENVGVNAYDIGHVFTVSSGGVASLGSVCTSRKAQGTTGTTNPVGDPFDIDFVAHEIGHQFGGTHTFNGTQGNCAGNNRTGSTAYEPGSGSTILAYAGICGSDNLQNNSDPFFHSVTLDQIYDFVIDDDGSNCAVTTSTGNTPPSVTVDKTEYTIPPNTPFKLDAQGADTDGDNLTYSWEQFDLGPAGAPQLPEGTAPLFRSFTPEPESFRIFPQLSSIVSGSSTFGEILPRASRPLNFRVVVRDNNPVGGGIVTESVRLFVNDESEPFRVTSQSLPNLSFIGGSTMEVTWEAGLTNLGDFNTKLVNVLLSTDGGVNFDITLIEETANDGSVSVKLPEVVTTEARIMVEAADNVFFNVNGLEFEITEATEPGYSLRVDPAPLKSCAPDDIQFQVFVDRFGGFDETVNLTIEGLDEVFETDITDDALEGQESAVITVSNTASATQSINMLNVTANSTSGIVASEEVELTIISGNTGKVDLIAPEDDVKNIDQLPTLVWEDSPIADSYFLEVATDADFTNIIITENSLLQPSFTPEFILATNTQYFWRVAINNECGRGDFEVAEFTVANLESTVESLSNLGVIIDENGTPTVTSTITIEDDFVIEDLNLIDLDISHTWIEDLTVTLISPAGTRVVLFSGICGSLQHVLTNFDDESPLTEIPCPPIGDEVF